MAHHKSALKRIRRNLRRTAINQMRVSRVRGLMKKVEEAVAGGDQDVARAALRAAEPEIMRGANRGVIKHNTASRKVSRMAARVNAIS
jgi:small subunit ribosomal protein S20